MNTLQKIVKKTGLNAENIRVEEEFQRENNTGKRLKPALHVYDDESNYYGYCTFADDFLSIDNNSKMIFHRG